MNFSAVFDDDGVLLREYTLILLMIHNFRREYEPK